jgi:hypothetical protein
VLGDDDSWPIEKNEGAEAYVDALHAVLSDPEDSRRRARALRERMLHERSADAFAAQATDLLLRNDARGAT